MQDRSSMKAKQRTKLACLMVSLSSMVMGSAVGFDEIMLLEIMLFFMEFFFPEQNFFHFCGYIFPKLPSFVYVQL